MIDFFASIIFLGFALVILDLEFLKPLWSTSILVLEALRNPDEKKFRSLLLIHRGNRATRTVAPAAPQRFLQ